MRLIDQFHHEGTEDAYAFVFDTQQDGLNDMLMMGENGYRHGYWTRGPYDPDGENTHLGQRVRFHELGNTVLNAFFFRLSIPSGTEAFYATLDQIADEHEEEVKEDETPSMLDTLDIVRRNMKEQGEGA